MAALQRGWADDASAPDVEATRDDDVVRRSARAFEDEPAAEQGEPAELPTTTTIIVADRRASAEDAALTEKSATDVDTSEQDDGLDRPNAHKPGAEAVEPTTDREQTTTELDPEVEEAKVLGEHQEDGLDDEQAGPGEELRWDEETAEDDPPVEELIEDFEVSNGVEVLPLSASDGGSDGNLTAWSGRVRTAVAAFLPAKLPSAERTSSGVQAAGSAAAAKWNGKTDEVKQEATRALEAKPFEPLPDIPPMPSPDPVPGATQRVASKAGRKLPDQKLPDLVLTPHGIRPTTAGSPGGTTVPPPTAAPPSVQTSAPVSKTPVEAINEAAAGVPALVPAVEPGQTLSGSERAPVYTIAAPKRAEIASVLARVHVEAEASGGKVFRDARKLAYRGVDLNGRPALMTLGDDLIPGERVRFQDEMSRLAEAANIGKQAFDEAVAARTDQLTEVKTQADTKLVQTTAEQTSLIDRLAGGVQSTIRSYHQTFSEHLDLIAAEAKGGVDPKEVRKEEERLKGLLRKHADEHVAAWGSMQKERHAKLARALTDQLAAYRVAAIMDERSRSGAPIAELTDPVLKKWLTNRGAEAAGAVGVLKDTIQKLVEGWQAEMRAARDEAVVLVGSWADERIGRERTWLEQLVAGLLSSVEARQAESAAIAEAQTQENLAALGQDLQLLEDLKGKGLAGLDRDASEHLMKQDQEQQALLTAYFQGGEGEKGDTVLYLARMLQLRLHRQRLPEAIGQVRAKVLELDNVKNWSDLESIGQTQSAGFSAQAAADRLWEAFEHTWGTDEDKAYDAVKGLTPEQGKAVRGVYEADHGENLDARANREMSDEQLDRVRYGLDGKKSEAAAAALRDAVEDAGTGEALINTVLRGKTADERKAIEEAYRSIYKEDLKTRLGEELSADDKAITEAHLEGNTEKADAIEIKVAKDAFWGPDHEKIEGVYNLMRSEATQAGDAQGWTSAQIDAEIARRSGKLQTEYKGVTQRDLLGDLEQAFTPPNGQGSPEQRAYAEQYWQGRRDLVLGMATGDLTRADAGKIQIERTGFYANDKTINKILALQYQRALEREKRDALVAFMAANKGRPPTEAQRDQLDKQAAAKALDTSRQSMNRLGDYVETHYTKGAASFEDTIKGLTQGLEEEKATALMTSGGHLQDWEILKFATEGLGTDDDALKNLLKSKKTRAEIDALEAEWQRNGHPGEKLGTLIEGETSGRLRNDLLLDYKYGGEPKDPAALIDKAKEQLAFEKRTGGVTHEHGPDGIKEVKSHEYEVLEKRLANLERRRAEYEMAQLLPDDDPRKAWQLLKWQAADAGLQSAVQTHRTMVDQQTELVAQVASMVVAITVGIALTALTGGTATLAFIAVVSSLAGSATGIVTKAAMKGAAYGADELGTDLAIGAVDAFVSALTAGVGDKLLKSAMATAKLGGAGAKGLLGTLGRMVEGSMAQRAMAHAISESAEGFIQTLPSAVLGTALDERTWTEGNPLLNLLMGTGTGLAIGTFTSGAIGGLTNLKKMPLAAATPDGPSHGQMAALLDAHADPGQLEARYFEMHPERTRADFRSDLDGVLLKRAEHDPELAASLQTRLRDSITELLPSQQKAQFSGTPVELWDAKRFEAFTGSQSGQAVVIVKDGQPTVLVKQGADPLRLAEEGFHLAQTIDPKTEAKIAHLDETKLAAWPATDIREKFPVYKDKVELEIDAQRRVIDALEARAASGGEDVAARLAAAKSTLANLEKRLGEVDRIGPFHRTLMAWGVLKQPQWLEQPPRLFAKSIDEIRAGLPGRLRSESELPDADIVRVLNDGLPHFTAQDVAKIIEQFPVAQQQAAREALHAMSGFASLDSFTKLAKHLRDADSVFKPGTGSLADNLIYLDSKQIFGPDTVLRSRYVESISDKTMVVLDEVVLHRIKNDPAFLADLLYYDCIILHPRGYIKGINQFTPVDEIGGRLKRMLDENVPLGEQLDSPLAGLPKELEPKIRPVDPVDPALLSDPDITKQLAAIAEQLSSKVGLAPDASITKILVDANIPPKYHALARELLVQQSEILNLPQMTALIRSHTEALINSLPPGQRQNVYFFAAEHLKSYGVLAAAHRTVSDIGVDKYITDDIELRKLIETGKLPADAALIVLDDISGSGSSMGIAVRAAESAGFGGRVLLAPLLGTPEARSFVESLSSPRLDISYHPAKEIPGLRDSKFYANLKDSPDLLDMLEKLKGRTFWGGSDLSVVFPYMSPDNNNSFFAHVFGYFFMLNQQPGIDAIKASPYTPPAD